MEIESVDSAAALKHITNTKEFELKIKKSLGIEDDKELTLQQENIYASLMSIKERWSIKEKEAQNSKISRPLHYIKKLKKLYPKAIEYVQGFKSGVLKKEKTLQLHSNLPKYSFIPFDMTKAIVCDENKIKLNQIPLHLAGDSYYLSCLIPWAFSQGIYKFDETLMSEILSSKISGDIPCDVLKRLPEWTVYVETPNMTFEKKDLYGFFATLQFMEGMNKNELIILLDTPEPNGLRKFPINLEHGSINEIIDNLFKETKTANKDLMELSDEGNRNKTIKNDLNYILSILLYICSEEPEIEEDKKPKLRPCYPQPKKLNGKQIYFQPEKSRIWNVGKQMGQKIREFDENKMKMSQSDRTVTPHLRRGHYHGYWKGPKNGEREFFYNWISPCFVSGNKEIKKDSSEII